MAEAREAADCIKYHISAGGLFFNMTQVVTVYSSLRT